ncbi:hypothetical protein HS088_TW01G00555 [Tripterygium wilfordii]|uniref:Uncharacterized protein n=1 Tax=Tripterygium wilfordii TaxID=458696 RepID=A0A7J7E1W6_TRIWF|nr:hypothetical protein HS088_TW01G00555 [Tripterygium wilfordii]
MSMFLSFFVVADDHQIHPVVIFNLSFLCKSGLCLLLMASLGVGEVQYCCVYQGRKVPFDLFIFSKKNHLQYKCGLTHIYNIHNVELFSRCWSLYISLYFLFFSFSNLSLFV